MYSIESWGFFFVPEWCREGGLKRRLSGCVRIAFLDLLSLCSVVKEKESESHRERERRGGREKKKEKEEKEKERDKETERERESERERDSV